MKAGIIRVTDKCMRTKVAKEIEKLAPINLY
jgi:hypothetical protein